jgi:hypothetical protein
MDGTLLATPRLISAGSKLLLPVNELTYLPS